jgi:hypothetical protein
VVLPKRLIPAAQVFFPLKVGSNTEAEKVVQETAQHAMAGLLSQVRERHW